ncbi:hypothetical protein N7457_003239 [Penicillium paradoxum]|uniref:uncharacterized protein n=1 Tax=Penicillium paradoxum TaxID=176176 RepID=UPI0025478541|nr:uncharacterized protein N7457_003239 [Penicillium paradoxum]KAJ5788249.1 hypothetical protein N7457_003239 [Penicillium paradoxum]
MYLDVLKHWSAFKIDALGLVTLLGVEAVDRAVGRLVQNPFTDWLPLMGAYTIASDQVVEPTPGFTLYNITDAILAADLTGWFTRWMLTQDLAFATTTLTLVTTSPPNHHRPSRRWILPFTIGILIVSALIILSILIEDWWALVAGLSMGVSVVVRQIILGQNRWAIDRAVAMTRNEPDEICKLFVTIPNGKAVTIYAPRRIIQGPLLTTPRPAYPRIYLIARYIGWAAFGGLVISLGMASLLCQPYSVVVLIVASTVTVRGIGDDERFIGSGLMIFSETSGDRDSRMTAYLKMQLSESEEATMLLWSLLPQRSNVAWWETYSEVKKLYTEEFLKRGE